MYDWRPNDGASTGETIAYQIVQGHARPRTRFVVSTVRFLELAGTRGSYDDLLGRNSVNMVVTMANISIEPTP
jgi:hypothetical protein